MIFDVEADGLLEDATKIHVLAYKSGSSIKHTHDYEEMRSILLDAKTLIGHNIIRYDIPLLEKILNIKIKARLIDTLGLSWYLNHKRLRHGLEYYGEDYGIPKPEIDDWKNLTPEEYAKRCREDVKINHSLWLELKEKLLSLYEDKKQANKLISYISFKLDCAREQERSGWKVNIEKAKLHLEELTTLQESKLDYLKKVMPSVPVVVKKTRPAKPFKKDGTYSVQGVKWFALLKKRNLPEDYCGEVEIIASEKEPNPNSTDQIKKWLEDMGWEPETFKFVRESDGSERQIPQVRVDTEDGKALCPSVLKLSEKFPEIKELEGLSVIQHRLSIFKGFVENEKNGYLKAEISGLTNTLRFKHKVLVNLPSVSKDWGKEIRGCLEAPEGHVLCGSDMVSLEDTTKRHYMWDYDPDYVLEMSKEGFDPHLDLAKFAGVVTQDDISCYLSGDKNYLWVKPIRKTYKVANYACVYGVGKYKLARETGLTLSKAEDLIEVYWKRNWSVKEAAESREVKTIDGEMWILNPVSNFWYSLRSEKDKFSTLNQGTGVYCFDSWIREFRSKRPQLTGQFHDEIISCLKQGLENKYEKLLRDSIKNVNGKLNLNVKLDIDVQFGKTYAEIH